MRGVIMISPVQNFNTNVRFTSGMVDKEELKKHPILIENTLPNRMRIEWEKFTNALIVYPARGLEGSKNSNFYEFLTMGTIPYLVGSAMLMAVFNGANKLFAAHKEVQHASKFGNKMALGVLFYGLFKNISKSFVTTPVKWMTGVDTEEPYAELKYKLPEFKDDTDLTNLEYHKVLESIEFPRWDVWYGDEAKGEPRNFRFDKMAKQMGLGTNLNDSDQDVKPRIKEIAVKTGLAKSISSYLWAAVGVGIAVQKPWDKFFPIATAKFWKIKPFFRTIKTFGSAFKESTVDFLKGTNSEPGFIPKHSGKFLAGLALLTTIAGVLNVVRTPDNSKKITPENVIDKNGKYVVN